MSTGASAIATVLPRWRWRWERVSAPVVRVARLVLRWPLFLAVLYLGLGAYFIHQGAFMGDSLSRVEIARGVIQSFDPGAPHFLGFTIHAPAIGFIWGPLLSLLEIPLVALASIFPALLKDGYAAVIVSSLFAVWGAVQFSRLLSERGLDRRATTVLTAGFALNPFVLMYACNGMSEVPYMALLLGAARRLSLWQQHRRTSDLALAGLWIGVAYLIRYEPAAAGMVTCAFVAVVTFTSETGTPRSRIRGAAVNGLILLFPLIFFAAAFSAISWWVTGQALQQLASQYGFAAQNGAQVGAVSLRVGTLSKQLLELAPLLPVVVPLAAALQWAHRRTLLAVVSVVIAPPLLFDVLEISQIKALDLTRYIILAIPLVILLMSSFRHWRSAGLALMVAGVAIMGGGAWVLTSQRSLAPQEYQYHRVLTGYLVGNYSDVSLEAPRQIAAWLDAQNFPRGSILTDVTESFSVLLETDHPDRFVTPPYQGFWSDLSAPYQHGIRYLITVNPVDAGSPDALNLYYPGLWEGCVNGTQLVLAVDGKSAVKQWRVYKILAPISPSSIHYDGTCNL